VRRGIAERRVVRRRPPTARVIHRGESHDDDAAGVPVAFEHLDGTAADEILAAGRFETPGDPRAVVGIAGGIVDVRDVDQEIRGHDVCQT
jgi:hypothetical protein